jgi:3-ketosteroid 9alpha-monooxygenase subunit A
MCGNLVPESVPLEAWHTVCKSDELLSGQVMEFTLGSDDLLVYRASGGEVRAVSAYCPHMNNYIPNGLPPESGLGALLVDDELQCPYHGWRFDEEGRCSMVPAGQRVPPRVRVGHPVLRRWHVRDQDGALQIGMEVVELGET